MERDVLLVKESGNEYKRSDETIEEYSLADEKTSIVLGASSSFGSNAAEVLRPDVLIIDGAAQVLTADLAIPESTFKVKETLRAAVLAGYDQRIRPAFHLTHKNEAETFLRFSTLRRPANSDRLPRMTLAENYHCISRAPFGHKRNISWLNFLSTGFFWPRCSGMMSGINT